MPRDISAKKVYYTKQGKRERRDAPRPLFPNQKSRMAFRKEANWMGLLGTLHNMAKSGQVNEINSVINQERASANASAQTTGKERRKFHHNMEISIASYR